MLKALPCVAGTEPAHSLPFRQSRCWTNSFIPQSSGRKSEPCRASPLGSTTVQGPSGGMNSFAGFGTKSLPSLYPRASDQEKWEAQVSGSRRPGTPLSVDLG